MADDRVKELVKEANELATMLHRVWACATDTGGQTPEEAQVIFDEAQALLKEHGIEV